MCLVFGGLQQVPVDAQKLYSIGTHLLVLTDALACLVSVCWHWRLCGEHRVNENARRGNLTRGTLAAQRQCFLGVAPYVADGRNAGREPDL